MEYNPYSLKGKTILVTGASSGIGQATAIECSRMGASVVITARNNDRLAQTMSLMEGVGHKMIIADLTDMESLNNLVREMPVIDGFSYNAGIACIKPVAFYKEADIQVVMQTNAIAAAMLTRTCIKEKKLAKKASLVFTSSIEGPYGTGVGNGIYGMSKAALSAFVKTAALELSTKGIRCNTINPGMVKTPLIDSGEISEEQMQKDTNKYPLKRYGEPKEIAHATIYLLSDAAAWITGTELKIDGGITLV